MKMSELSLHAVQPALAASCRYNALNHRLICVLLLSLFTSFASLSAQQVAENSIQICFYNELEADSIISLRPDLSFERIIPYAPKPELERRHREAGLHLWYKAEVKNRDAISKEVAFFSSFKGVRIVNPTEFVSLYGAPLGAECLSSERLSDVSSVSAAVGGNINDPLYLNQWHYSNPDYANINLERAWVLETGKRNVIVAVMDGWIDHEHPDIAPNMWVNEAELNGLPGVDDDGNGYVDDIYGLNSTNSDIPSDHATHIAGTIAAVNGNGIGVCGIAGGNGTDTGVRVMSVAINAGTQFVSDWKLAQAFVYAADNGAVISSNSWRGYDEPSPVKVAGLKYFMDYAGHFENSPMKGGLIVFAAGNDNDTEPVDPFASPQIHNGNLITVAALSCSGVRSSFSNYGSWVDIAAPGGEFDGKGVYSCFTGNRYGFMNGTSMACPHVSGVAALVVSKFGDGLLTPSEVKSKLLKSATPVDPYQAGYPYTSKLGAGIVNAYLALCDTPLTPPRVPYGLSAQRNRDGNVLFSWTVPSDGNGNAVAECLIYADDVKIPLVSIKTSAYKVGQTMTYYGEKAYVDHADSYRIQSVDIFGNRSEMSEAILPEDFSDVAIYNPYCATNLTVYRPSSSKYERPLPAIKVRFPIQNSPLMKHRPYVDEPNGVIRKTGIFYNTIEWEFDVTSDTPLGCHPLIVKLMDDDDPEDVATLELSYIVREALEHYTGPVAKNPDDMHFYTSSLTGTLDLNVRDYLYEPYGLEFEIPDMEFSDDFGMNYLTLKYSVIDEKLHVEYEFDENALYFDDSPIMVSIHAFNSYFTDGAPAFFIHYNSDSGIENVTVEENPVREGVFTVTGMKLSVPVDQLPSGVYIVDGKKVVVH